MQCNLNLDEKTIAAMDEAAERLNLSRSKVAETILSATLGTAPDGVKSLFTVFFGEAFKNTYKARRDARKAEADEPTDTNQPVIADGA